MATGTCDDIIKHTGLGLGRKCKYKQALQKLYMEIPPLITYPEELTGHLYANLVITDPEKDRLRRVLDNDSVHSHNKQLIDILLKKSEPHIKTFLKILEENMDCENLANHIRSVADECEAQSKLTQRTATGIKRQLSTEETSSDDQTDTPKHELEIVLRRQTLPTFSHPHKKQKLFVQRTGHLLISMKAYQGSDENIGYIKHKVWEMKSELSTAAGIVCGCKFNDQRSEIDRENTCTAALSVSFESGEKAIYQLFESKLFDFENYVLEDKAIIVSLEKKCIKITVEVEDVDKLRELQKDIESGALLHRMVVWLQYNGLSCEDDDYLVIVVDAIKIKQLQQQLQNKAQILKNDEVVKDQPETNSPYTSDAGVKDQPETNSPYTTDAGVKDQLSSLKKKIDSDPTLSTDTKKYIHTQIEHIEVAVEKDEDMTASIMTEFHAQKLRLKRVYLVDHVVPKPLLSHFRENKILTLDNIELLQSQPNSMRMCQMMLDLLPRSGPRAYESLIQALKETGQLDIAYALESFDSTEDILQEAKAFEVMYKPDIEQSSIATEDTPGFLETSDYGSIVSELQATKEVNSLIKQPFITSQQYDAVLIHSHDDTEEATFFKQCMERFIVLPNKQSASIYMAEWNEIRSRAFDLEGLVKDCCLWFMLINKHLGESQIIKDDLMLLHAKSAGRLVPVMKKEADYLSLKDTYMSSHHLKYVWQKQGVIIDHLVKGKVCEDFRNLNIEQLTRSDVNQQLVDKLLLLFNYYLNERLSQVKQKKQALLEWMREEDVTDNTHILAEFMDEVRKKEGKEAVFNKAVFTDEKQLYDIMKVDCKDKFHELSKPIGGFSVPYDISPKALLQSWKEKVDASEKTWRELYDVMLQFKCVSSAAQFKLVCDKDSLVKNLKEIEYHFGEIGSVFRIDDYLYSRGVLKSNQYERIRDPYNIAPSNRWKYLILEVLVDEPCNYDIIKNFFQAGVEAAKRQYHYYYLKTLMLCQEDLDEDE